MMSYNVFIFFKKNLSKKKRINIFTMKITFWPKTNNRNTFLTELPKFKIFWLKSSAAT